MKIIRTQSSSLFITALCLGVTACLLLAVAPARAGLALELNLIRYDASGYYFSPYLNTNNTAPSVPFGDYTIASLNAPTNGSWARYHFDAAGFNQVDGSSWGYGDFATMVHELTNGNWTIWATNSATTNRYQFAVSATLTSNALSELAITYPTNGATQVPNQPMFTWQGPADFSGLIVYEYNYGIALAVTDTNWPSANVLPLGTNEFTVHYDNYPTTGVVAATPVDQAAQPISSWVSTLHLQDYRTSQFVVGPPEPVAGQVHTLIARYDFEQTNAPGVDSSGNGNDSNCGGGSGTNLDTYATDFAAGAFARRFQGDTFICFQPGMDSFASLSNALAGSFSVSAWVKTTNTVGLDYNNAYFGAAVLFAYSENTNSTVPLSLTGSKAAMTVNDATGGTTTLHSTTSVNDGQYHQIVVTRSQANGVMKMYVDGNLEASAAGPTDPLFARGTIYLAGGWYADFAGLLDDVQIYSGVISSAEVAGLFAAPGSTVANVSVVNAGHTQVAHYAFDDSGNPGLDSSGHDNSLTGASWWGPVQQFDTDAVAGGGAVEFFGTSALTANGQVLTHLNNLLAGSFTVSGWVKTTAAQGNDQDNAISGATIFWAYNDHNGTNDTIPLAITGSKPAFTTRDHLGNSSTLHASTSVNDGTYHLLTVTRDQLSGEKKIYVDGSLEATELGTTDPLNGNDYFLAVGGSVLSSYTGRLDDLQLYSGVLSASEVVWLYQQSGTMVADVAAQDFNAALNTTNFAWLTSGATNWFVENTNAYDTVAARSGSVTGDQTSTLETTVTGPGLLTFWWQSPSGNSLDLEFYLDGSYQDSIWNAPNWTQAGPYTIPAGQHTLAWTVYANGDTDATEAGYLDQVHFVLSTAPVITVNPFSQTNRSGYTVALYAAATSNVAVTWQWFKVGDGSPIVYATNGLFIPTNSGTAGVAGSYYGVVSNPQGSSITTTAVVSFVTAALPPDWARAFRSPMLNNSTDATTNYNIACVLDSTGTNLYTAGSVDGINSFGADSLVTPSGHSGSSILKQTTTGTAVWGRAMTNNGNGSSYSQCVALAPGDGVYISGDFFGTNWLGTNRLVDIANGSVFVARFDAAGNLLWVRSITGTNANYTEYHRLVADPAGNVNIAVLLSGTTSLGTTNLFANGQQGVLVQYDANGNVRWTQAASSWPGYLAYAGGCIYGSMGGGAANYIGGATNVSDRQQAIFSINATNGQGNWVRGLGGAQGTGNPSGFSDDFALVAVSGTNLFVAGSAWGSNAVCGAYAVNFPAAKGQYLARYDTNGNAQLATAFGSQFVWPWVLQADAAGNVYLGGDFDTYAVFGNDLIAAPFYNTVQFVGSIEYRIPGQGFVAKFDRNGNALWARSAQSESSYLNNRDLALAPDGVWNCGFFGQVADFGTHVIYGAVTVVGSPIGYVQYHPGGYLAKITDAALVPLAVTLLNPQSTGTNFQFQFLSQSGFSHAVQYRTNLALGSWQTYTNVAGDGGARTILIPPAVFSPAQQGFVRVVTQ